MGGVDFSLPLAIEKTGSLQPRDSHREFTEDVRQVL
jgi:hypothetical protein